MSKFKDRRGVEYSSEREGNPRYDAKGLTRTDGFTIRRISPRPVDIKREQRRAKRAA